MNRFSVVSWYKLLLLLLLLLLLIINYYCTLHVKPSVECQYGFQTANVSMENVSVSSSCLVEINKSHTLKRVAFVQFPSVGQRSTWLNRQQPTWSYFRIPPLSRTSKAFRTEEPSFSTCSRMEDLPSLITQVPRRKLLLPERLHSFQPVQAFRSKGMLISK